jgi:DNA-binding NarL/FixJ family response regulator
MDRTTLVVADDHPLVRSGIRALLEEIPGYHIVGEASNGHEAIQLVERLQPDLLVVDLTMPELGGIEVTRRVSQASPRTRVIVLSMHTSDLYVLEALRSGAAGYVCKGSRPGELLDAIQCVRNGQSYLSPSLTGSVIAAYVRNATSDSSDPYDLLTTREREVLHLAAEGHSSTEIATRLSISPRTVETHRYRVMRKLGLRTQTDLVRYAMQRGLLSLD